MKIAKLQFSMRLFFKKTPSLSPCPWSLSSGIPDTGLSVEEGTYRVHAVRRFQFNIRPTTFPGGHTHKGSGGLLFRAGDIFYPLFYFFFFFDRTESSRHVLPTPPLHPSSFSLHYRHLFPSSNPIQFRKKQEGFLFLFYFIQPCPDFYLRAYFILFFCYLLCGPKMTIK